MTSLLIGRNRSAISWITTFYPRQKLKWCWPKWMDWLLSSSAKEPEALMTRLSKTPKCPKLRIVREWISANWINTVFSTWFPYPDVMYWTKVRLPYLVPGKRSFRDILMHWNIIHLPTRPRNCIWIKWTKDGRSTGIRLYGQMKMEKLWLNVIITNIPLRWLFRRKRWVRMDR